MWADEMQERSTSPSFDPIREYSKPKVLRLAEALLEYKPEHVGNFRRRQQQQNSR